MNPERCLYAIGRLAERRAPDWFYGTDSGAGVYTERNPNPIAKGVMVMEWSLDQIPLGQQAVVLHIAEDTPLSHQLQQMGITEGVQICRKRQAPLGDPSVYLVRGSALALRAQDAAHILVRPLHISVAEGESPALPTANAFPFQD